MQPVEPERTINMLIECGRSYRQAGVSKCFTCGDFSCDFGKAEEQNFGVVIEISNLAVARELLGESPRSFGSSVHLQEEVELRAVPTDDSVSIWTDDRTPMPRATNFTPPLEPVAPSTARPAEPGEEGVHVEQMRKSWAERDLFFQAFSIAQGADVNSANGSYQPGTHRCKDVVEWMRTLSREGPRLEAADQLDLIQIAHAFSRAARGIEEEVGDLVRGEATMLEEVLQDHLISLSKTFAKIRKMVPTHRQA